MILLVVALMKIVKIIKLVAGSIATTKYLSVCAYVCIDLQLSLRFSEVYGCSKVKITVKVTKLTKGIVYTVVTMQGCVVLVALHTFLCA